MSDPSNFQESICTTAVAIDADKTSRFARIRGWQRKFPEMAAHQHKKSYNSYSFLTVAFAHVKGKERVLHNADVANALISYILDNCITNIIVGASNRNLLTRKLKNADVPTALARAAPDFCTVHVVAKGKVQTVKKGNPPPSPPNEVKLPTASVPAMPYKGSPSISDTHKSALLNQASQVSLSQPASPGPENNPPSSLLKNLLPEDNLGYDVTINSFTMSSTSSWKSGSSDRSSFEGHSDYSSMSPGKPMLSSSTASSSQNPMFNKYRLPFASQSYGSDAVRSYQSPGLSFENTATSPESSNSSWSFTSQAPEEIDAELRRLKLELMQTMEMYNGRTQGEAIAKSPEDGATGSDVESAEKETWWMIEIEKQKARAAMEAAQAAHRLAELEAHKRRTAERLAKQEKEEKMKALKALAQNEVRYRKYTIEEIKSATENFSAQFKIGEGGYGPVYKGFLDHTAVAIKLLKSDAKQGKKQFQQEIEVLSAIRHPNMVLLLGACPEHGCLVYEYMENGSLEDRLFCKNNTPPIPWTTRFKIACEIATGLLFLHQAKPEPLVHRDLKPGNILLDRNYLSKISDVGLARLVPSNDRTNTTTMPYAMTAAAGTFCYIDPEYQQSGLLNVKSDIYSLGILLLQIITGKPPMGLTHHVHRAIRGGTFAGMIDPNIKDCPFEAALSFTELALSCAELRRKDRPDLGTEVLPELTRLKEFGMAYEATFSKLRRPLSSLFPLQLEAFVTYLALVYQLTLTNQLRASRIF
ncbi:Serine-threonine/tyrosine-protein kinase, catalytic domain [Dillenia turbinata]|uniref:Serine-threonine/tyrosine-protein kinase, catalytic domain n=1 Tax=Dillenia turbinata TaxID=194707 RepID=A0AAN8UJT4_9MAGN